MEATTAQILQGAGAVLAPVATMFVAWLGFGIKKYSQMKVELSEFKTLENEIIRMIMDNVDLSSTKKPTPKGTKQALRKLVREYDEDNKKLLLQRQLLNSNRRLSAASLWPRVGGVRAWIT